MMHFGSHSNLSANRRSLLILYDGKCRFTMLSYKYLRPMQLPKGYIAPENKATQSLNAINKVRSIHVVFRATRVIVVVAAAVV